MGPGATAYIEATPPGAKTSRLATTRLLISKLATARVLCFLPSPELSFLLLLSNLGTLVPHLSPPGTMPRRKVATRGRGALPGVRRTPATGTPGSAGVRATSTPGSARVRATGTPRTPGVGRIQKNTGSNRNLRRSSRNLPDNTSAHDDTDTEASTSNSEADEASEYQEPSQNISQPLRSSSATPALSTSSYTMSAERSTQHRSRQPSPRSHPALNIDDIRELLQSHEEDIINRVVLQLNSNKPHAPPPTPTNQSIHRPSTTLTGLRITELEKELAQLRAEQETEQGIMAEPRALGTYHPTHPFAAEVRESASSVTESVESLFPGVERGTLVQIIENRFKPTNIYRLLATEKERAESQRTISIGGIEFEQSERDGKESEYKMSGFFKAWAAYSGILVKLAPQALQGELATALFIYTMNLYDLLEKYTWDGVKAYHFQFHRKRVASGKGIYYPSEWRQIDSELIASKCFAHPHIPRQAWAPNPNRPTQFPRRAYELPIRESSTTAVYPQPSTTSSTLYGPPDRRSNPHYSGFISNTLALTGNRVPQNPPQVCRNWNLRECHSAFCRHQHICLNCGRNHKSLQCTQTQGISGLSHPARTGPNTR